MRVMKKMGKIKNYRIRHRLEGQRVLRKLKVKLVIVGNKLKLVTVEIVWPCGKNGGRENPKTDLVDGMEVQFMENMNSELYHCCSEESNLKIVLKLRKL